MTEISASSLAATSAAVRVDSEIARLSDPTVATQLQLHGAVLGLVSDDVSISVTANVLGSDVPKRARLEPHRAALR